MTNLSQRIYLSSIYIYISYRTRCTSPKTLNFLQLSITIDTKFPELNADIEKFMNKKRSFPDRIDISVLVKSSLTRQNITLTLDAIGFTWFR